ncbi:FeoC-like transcriptional regulator [Halochromatium salexigens]|uniref:Transcriptional regulator HTH-type FeoC domain-containing protein n=1 Tax=Halochromatium salexigens TaxID=49447 RepID=A0AAJ0XGC3_HALSE|nr:hypothetical protein [Halochromatium salexigens]
MLIQARDLVRQQGLASLQEVALQLGVSSEVARALLAKWVAKGRIERLPTATACSGCTLCDSAPRELYRWSGNRADSAAHSRSGRSSKVPSTCPAAGPSQGQGCDWPDNQSSS